MEKNKFHSAGCRFPMLISGKAHLPLELRVQIHFLHFACVPWKKCQVLRMTKNITRRRSLDWDHPVYMDLKSFWWKPKNIYQQNDANLNTKVEDGHLICAISWNNWSSDSLEQSESYTSSQHLLFTLQLEKVFEKPHVTSCLTGLTGVITLPTHACWEQIPQKYFRFAFFHYLLYG